LSWRLSNTLDASFCIEALEEAIMKYGTPCIFNTDQGSQFTSDSFTAILKAHGIRISMDSQGSWRDNIIIERLWKTVKYEEIYLKAYESISHVKKELARFFDRYNTLRPHRVSITGPLMKSIGPHCRRRGTQYGPELRTT